MVRVLSTRAYGWMLACSSRSYLRFYEKLSSVAPKYDSDTSITLMLLTFTDPYWMSLLSSVKASSAGYLLLPLGIRYCLFIF